MGSRFYRNVDTHTPLYKKSHARQPYILIMYLSTLQNFVFVEIRFRWAGHVARMGERRGAYRALVGKPEGRLGVGAQTGLIWLRIGTGGGLLCIR
jgi:hypothetical protein